MGERPHAPYLTLHLAAEVPSMAVYQHDVLIIGAGLAGMRAGLAAQLEGADVAIITKVHPVRSHSNAAQGGINAAVDEDDTWEDHAFDTVKGSDYLGDQDAIEVLCSEAGPEVLALERMGVIFHRGEDGKLGSRAFGGQQRARTYFVGDITGQAMLHVLYEQLIKQGLRVYEEWFVLDLIVEDGVCKGCVAMEIRTGQISVIGAKAVIMATGGAGRVYEPSTNALICTGDGISLAYRAGAPIMDMEMVQFHPTTLQGSGVLITEGARGEGAYLLNGAGERFMEKYAPNMMELAAATSCRAPSRQRLTKVAAPTAASSSICATWAKTSSASACGRSARSASTSKVSTSPRSRSRSCPACTTSWAVSRRTSGAAPPSPASTPRAKRPASASTAPTGSAPTRCSTP